MKCISLWQPWASAIAVGAKRIETRSWSTAYRGPLAIHAAKRFVYGDMLSFHCSWNWTGALGSLGFGMVPGLPPEQRDAPLETKLPLGAIVATCRLADCRRTDDFTQAELDTVREPTWGEPDRHHLYAWSERLMGDFALGRFGWVLADVQMLAKPIPFRGAQGLFDVPDEVIADATREAA